jgi:hypothetical protein
MYRMMVVGEGEVWLQKQTGMIVADNRLSYDQTEPPQPRDAFLSFSEIGVRYR